MIKREYLQPSQSMITYRRASFKPGKFVAHDTAFLPESTVPLP